MLSDQEKEQIRFEEIFRAEVQRSLQASKAPRGLSKLAKVLSTPLGLWILSTIVVGFGSWIYAQASASAAAERQRQESVRQLDSEIAFRLTALRNLKRTVGLDQAISLLQRPDDPIFPIFLFPENAKRPLSALLWQLSRTVPKPEQLEIEKAYNTSIKLSALQAEAAAKRQHFARFMRARLIEAGLAVQFKIDLNLSRWGSQFDKGIEPDSVFGDLISTEALQKKVGVKD